MVGKNHFDGMFEFDHYLYKNEGVRKLSLWVMYFSF